jgi:hypothetical protein
MMQNKLQRPIFIGGTGRSGTTILKTVLQQHSDIVTIPNELRITIDPDGILDLLVALTDRWTVNRADVAIRRFDRLISTCLKEPLITQVLMGLKRRKLWPLTTGGYYGTLSCFGDDYVRSRTNILMEELISYQSKAELINTPSYRFRPTVYEAGPFEKGKLVELLQRYVNDLYNNLPVKTGASCWLDDTPHNILHAVELSQLFKDMKLIHVYRDPRDVVSSYMTKKWGGDNWEQSARRVAAIYRQWHLIRRGLSSEQFIEISLEDLSGNQKPTLQKVCDHIGIDFEDRLLDIKLDKTNSGRWQQEIPSTVLGVVNGHLSPYLSEYNFVRGRPIKA